MSEAQLREAFTLMKQGDKKAAAQIVQNVLREDRNNLNAWWLFANLLDDEEKVVKSLERVLALNPDHAGARKKLASMRPEYAHLAAAPEADKAKSKADQKSAAYWSKLDNEYTIREKAHTKATMKEMIFSSMGVRLIIVLALVPFMVAYAIFFNWRNQESFTDKNGDTPLTIASQYLEAIYREDFDTIYAIACPQYYPEIEDMQAEAYGVNPADVTVDMSETDFSLYYQNGDQAFVEVSGITLVDYGDGNFLEIDWAADSIAEGIDVFGEHFYRTDEVWQVCIERYVPDLEFDGEEE